MKSKDVIQAYNILRHAKLSQREKEALKVLGEFLPKALEFEAARMPAFVKLYAHCFTKYCVYYNTTPEASDIPQKELHRILEGPLEPIMETAAQEFNAIRTYHYLQDRGRAPRNSELYTQKEVSDNLRAQAAKALLEYR